jgi:hypothetical protein
MRRDISLFATATLYDAAASQACRCSRQRTPLLFHVYARLRHGVADILLMLLYATIRVKPRFSSSSYIFLTAVAVDGFIYFAAISR